MQWNKEQKVGRGRIFYLLMIVRKVWYISSKFLIKSDFETLKIYEDFSGEWKKNFKMYKLLLGGNIWEIVWSVLQQKV